MADKSRPSAGTVSFAATPTDVAVSVAGLLGPSGPTAIVWAVWAVVVNALNSHKMWSTPHVGQEVCKRTIPSFAHSDAAPAVPVKVFKRRVVAAIPHSNPNPIFA